MTERVVDPRVVVHERHSYGASHAPIRQTVVCRDQRLRASLAPIIERIDFLLAQFRDNRSAAIDGRLLAVLDRRITNKSLPLAHQNLGLGFGSGVESVETRSRDFKSGLWRFDEYVTV